MKNMKKTLILLLCAVLLVGASVAGTLAFLTDGESVTNTFTVGKVDITLDEADVDEYGNKRYEADGTTEKTRVTENEYLLVPGHNYVKDPTINVLAGSEDSWLFAKIENGLGDAAAINMVEEKWKDLGNGYFAYTDKVLKRDDEQHVTIFTDFTFSNTVDSDTIGNYANKTIVVTAYAIQADGFATSDAAWTALADQLNL